LFRAGRHADRPAYGHASDFVAEGFVEAIRSRGIAADVALADATLPYYRDREAWPKLLDAAPLPRGCPKDANRSNLKTA
jgi:hypothetical protein